MHLKEIIIFRKNLVTNGRRAEHGLRQSGSQSWYSFLIGNSSRIFNYIIFFATMFFIVDIFWKLKHKSTNLFVSGFFVLSFLRVLLDGARPTYALSETFMLPWFPSSTLLSSVKLAACYSEVKCCNKWQKIVTKSSQSPPFRLFSSIIYLRY